MATTETKKRIALAMGEALNEAVQRGEVSPTEGEEIVEAVLRALKRTNSQMRAAGKGDFIDHGAPDEEKEWN